MTPRTRKVVTTIHVVASVGLLGAVSVLLLLAIVAATTDDARLADSAYELMNLETVTFGIPCTFISLFSGVALGLGTRWGVLRYWWTATKLALNIAVLLTGSLVIGPSIEAMRDDPAAGAEWRVVAGAGMNVSFLLVAASLGVFKPGGRLRRQRPAASPAT